jgi:hypothetical protein
VRHELDHIADIRSSLNEYGDSLSLHVFPSETTCISFIKDEVKLFGEKMNLIQRLTTIKRDGVQYALSTEH